MLYNTESAAELRNLLVEHGGLFCDETGVSEYLVEQWLKGQRRMPKWPLPYLRWRSLAMALQGDVAQLRAEVALLKTASTSMPAVEPLTTVIVYVKCLAPGSYRCVADGVLLTLELCPDTLWRVFYAGIAVAVPGTLETSFRLKRSARSVALEHHKWMFASKRGLSIEMVRLEVKYGDPPSPPTAPADQAAAQYGSMMH